MLFASKSPPNCGELSLDKSVSTAEKDNVPEPFVFKNCPAEPSAVGWVIPSINTAPEPIRQQAFAYKENIRKILIDYVGLAKKEERASIVNILRKNGGNDLANLIRRM